MASSSTEETRAAKRPRISESDAELPSAPATFTRGQPWFDDGNLILQSHDGVRFKVYRGLFALHSTVFADMLSLPQPAQQDLVDGCPLVVLSESGKELTQFHELIAGQTGSFFRSDNVSFEQLSVMLRLGSKYNVQRLRDNAIRILREAFPDTLEDHDSHDSDLLSLAATLEFAWLAFSEEVDIVLPLICYECHCLPEPVLMRDDTLKRMNGDEFKISNEFKIFIAAGLISAFIEQTKLIFTWLKPTGSALVPKCATKIRCRKALDSLAQAYLCEDRTRENGLYILTNQPWWPPEPDFCSECIKMLEERHEEDRAKLWEALPTFFNLPSWENLRRQYDPLRV
ncbi:hypothetical protein DL96DRAFT_1013202 [Flagelloscypha sp. PMI_526]|nr:hypothetical protein DL96DRAFT_1013202 [Flagelloscypha sp. PMI_526]